MCEPTTIALVASSLVGAGTAVYQGKKARDAAKDAQEKQEELQKEADKKAAIPKPTMEDPNQRDTEAERRKRVKSLQFGMQSTIKSSLNKKSLGLKTKLGQ